MQQILTDLHLPVEWSSTRYLWHSELCKSLSISRLC